MCEIFKGMHKKAKGNFDCLISFLTRAIGLRVIGHAVKQLEA